MAEVTNNPAENKYDISVDGEVVGSAYYTLTDKSIIFTHTEVNPSRQEHGLGSQLVTYALDDVRNNSSLRVVAQCPFVSHFIANNPDYQDLLHR